MISSYALDLGPPVRDRIRRTSDNEHTWASRGQVFRDQKDIVCNKYGATSRGFALEIVRVTKCVNHRFRPK